MWSQKLITFHEKKRGFHLVTDEVRVAVPELADYELGMLNLHLQHTSASLTLNENADPGVRRDMERFFLETVPDHGVVCGRCNREPAHYEHDDEGPDDMPAHIKSSLLGVSVSIPIQGGDLALGTWQGIYLGEHRVHGGDRRALVTIHGQGFAK